MNLTFIGIDLGTSNCATAYKDGDSWQTLPISQKIDSHQEGEKSTLPSAIYIAPNSEKTVVGTWAKEQGKDQPNRTVVSPKSWLCFDQVDRNAAILPWNSEIKENKLSPVTASTTILSQIKSTLDSRNLSGPVVITVPASFDETAKRLTVTAAKAAGFDDFTLLEEPLAAVYSWISQDEQAWKDQVQNGDVLLVCDVGGGTSDFSLVAVTEEENGNLGLERISVGRHLLLGGDNMDLALAYRASYELTEKGSTLDEWQMRSLIYQAGIAKEELLADSSKESYTVGIESRGSNLFAQALSVEIKQEWIQQILLDGFFPHCNSTDQPEPNGDAGLQEFGLNYEKDPAITKHLAKFLSQAASSIATDERLKELVGDKFCSEGGKLKITKVLFNGGVFNGSSLKERVLEVLSSWSNDSVAELL